jgi:hypothetical protein
MRVKKNHYHHHPANQPSEVSRISPQISQNVFRSQNPKSKKSHLTIPLGVPQGHPIISSIQHHLSYKPYRSRRRKEDTVLA